MPPEVVCSVECDSDHSSQSLLRLLLNTSNALSILIARRKDGPFDPWHRAEVEFLHIHLAMFPRDAWIVGFILEDICEVAS